MKVKDLDGLKIDNQILFYRMSKKRNETVYLGKYSTFDFMTDEDVLEEIAEEEILWSYVGSSEPLPTLNIVLAPK